MSAQNYDLEDWTRPIGGWRDGNRRAMIWGIDAGAFAPIIVWGAKVSWATFYIAIAGIVLFAVLGRFGLTLPVFIRLVRSKLRGSVCYSQPWWVRRRFMHRWWLPQGDSK